jgi:DNA-binding transcriptional LysR family regulator
VKAAGSDPVRQSQYSRQIKELEDFFKIGLVERHGKGIRLTASGRELARISRFFLLGLSSFQRGCLTQAQTYRIAAPATFIACFLLPAISKRAFSGLRWKIECAEGDEAERKLHDLTVDFAIVSRAALSRPLQTVDLSEWDLRLWVHQGVCRTGQSALKAYQEGRLPLAFPGQEVPPESLVLPKQYEPAILCSSFLEAQTALARGCVAAWLPEFLFPLDGDSGEFFSIPAPGAVTGKLAYRLAWNPRLARLNPQAQKARELLVRELRQADPSVLRFAGGAVRNTVSPGRQSPKR